MDHIKGNTLQSRQKKTAAKRHYGGILIPPGTISVTPWSVKYIIYAWFSSSIMESAKLLATYPENDAEISSHFSNQRLESLIRFTVLNG